MGFLRSVTIWPDMYVTLEGQDDWPPRIDHFNFALGPDDIEQKNTISIRERNPQGKKILILIFP